MSKAELTKLFSFVPLAGPEIEKVGALRAAGLELALELVSLVPACQMRDSAVHHVLEAVMLGNAAIANTPPQVDPDKTPPGGPPPGPPA